MNICYSNTDISNKLNGKVQVMTYPELYNYDTIDGVLGPHGAAVILYMQQPQFGHWCCIFKEDGVLYFFDSYAIFPDDQLEDIAKKFRIKSGQNFGYLSHLMGISPYECDYNDHQLQSEVEGINTCGRWCVARIKNRHLSSDQFAELFGPDDMVTPDEIVVEYTDGLNVSNNNNN